MSDNEEIADTPIEASSQEIGDTDKSLDTAMFDDKEGHDEHSTSSSRRKRSEGARKPGLSKTRLVLSTSESHPLMQFQNQLKQRMIKSFDMNQFVADLLEGIPTERWDEVLEASTPLEYKINAALSDPDMREKLTMLLSSEQMKDAGGDVLYS